MENKMNQLQAEDLKLLDSETQELYLESQKLHKEIIEKIERGKIK